MALQQLKDTSFCSVSHLFRTFGLLSVTSISSSLSLVRIRFSCSENKRLRFEILLSALVNVIPRLVDSCPLLRAAEERGENAASNRGWYHCIGHSGGVMPLYVTFVGSQDLGMERQGYSRTIAGSSAQGLRANAHKRQGTDN